MQFTKCSADTVIDVVWVFFMPYVRADFKSLSSCNRVYCIHVPGHDPITFSFRSFSFFDWVGVLWPQLSKAVSYTHLRAHET